MTITRGTVRLNMLSGVAEDAVVNVWHFEHTGPTLAQGAVICDALWGFYRSLNGLLSAQVSRATDSHVLTLATVTPGGPGPDDDATSKVVYTQLSGATFGVANSLQSFPPEMAMCLSFRGDIAGLNEEVGATRPISRRRGRIFLGPFALGVTNTTGQCLFPNAICDLVIDDYIAFINALTDPSDITNLRHVLYSPTSSQTHEIIHAWVDNAPDTIRSRGLAPTFRGEADIVQGDS